MTSAVQKQSVNGDAAGHIRAPPPCPGVPGNTALKPILHYRSLRGGRDSNPDSYDEGREGCLRGDVAHARRFHEFSDGLIDSMPSSRSPQEKQLAATL